MATRQQLLQWAFLFTFPLLLLLLVSSILRDWNISRNALSSTESVREKVTCLTTTSHRNDAAVDHNNDVDQVVNPPLRDIHVVMIGDSLMRYQYLSLVYRLRHGQWFNTSQWRYNLVCERGFESPFHNQTWGEFFLQTNNLLYPYEVCDCYRKPVEGIVENVENRYYYDPRFNNSVTFLLAFGHMYPPAGRLAPQDVRTPSRGVGWQRQALGAFQGPTWQYGDWSDLIRHHVRYLDPQPRYLVLNAGLWHHRFGRSPSSSSSQHSTGELLSNDTINLIQVIQETPQYHYAWRTTNRNKNREYPAAETDDLMCHHVHSCINVSFTKQVSRRLYWDMNHLVEPYYRVVNEDMLDAFGYLPNKYVRMNRTELFSNTFDLQFFGC